MLFTNKYDSRIPMINVTYNSFNDTSDMPGLCADAAVIWYSLAEKPVACTLYYIHVQVGSTTYWLSALVQVTLLCFSVSLF